MNKDTKFARQNDSVRGNASKVVDKLPTSSKIIFSLRYVF
ncbi:Protein of unknown function [Lactobacillus pasteurii DSM 23907 = CRBIP 24.76]|uniref:Uncharacterized protein n=1 Tax=Lactobacillus pasteurii DSM 23907 = CRBIP 24.76 TaxID=1423790 RepID=I7JY59_9LACO|nr:Protein of unknown function [Lactobacillus pasteurii DSM 23907 = CRBIP 24.76]